MKPAAPLRPCVFFDRDGIVNRSPGPGYVNHLDDFHVLPGFADCVRAAAAKGWPAVIVTNQRGIERGLTPPAQLDAMHAKLRAELAAEGLALLDVLVCTADDESGLRAAASIKKHLPGIKIIIMTSMPEHSFLRKAQACGCDGFWYKEYGDAELLDVC